MPRVARSIPEEGVLHITARRNNKRMLFRKEKDLNYMRYLLDKYSKRYLCPIYHYVFMPTHIHLIVEFTGKGFLSKMMHGICMKYAMYYNKKYGLIGHFWQDRFKSFVIDTDEYLLACGIYIEKNPVKAGLVAKPENYKWSSYNFYAFGKKNEIIKSDPFYNSLAQDAEGRKTIYRKIMNARLAETEAL